METPKEYGEGSGKAKAEEKVHTESMTLVTKEVMGVTIEGRELGIEWTAWRKNVNGVSWVSG